MSLRLVLFPLLLLAGVTGCLSLPLRTVDSSATQATTGHCEISFSSMPYEANEARLGSARLVKLANIRKDFDRERAFIESFADITLQTVELVGGQNFSQQADMQTIMGGYQGFTSPALSLRFSTNNQEERATITRIGAALGYVYFQDSVLIQCDPLASDTDLHPVFDLTESGPVDSINTETLKSVYGMLIGEADGNLNIGFSYYPTEDRFSTIGFIDNGKGERLALMRLINTLERLTNLQGIYQVEDGRVWVQFPANNWLDHPRGSIYLTGNQLESLQAKLDQLQQRFVAGMDAILEN